MSRNDKMKFIRLIEGSQLHISDALAQYDVPVNGGGKVRRVADENRGTQALLNLYTLGCQPFFNSQMSVPRLLYKPGIYSYLFRPFRRCRDCCKR